MNTNIRTALQKLVGLGAKLNPFPRQYKVPWDEAFVESLVAWAQSEGTIDDYWRRDALDKLRDAAMRYRLGVYSAEELEIYEDRARAILSDWGATPPAPKPVPGGFPDAPCQCSNCLSKDLEWGSYIQYITGDTGGYKTKSVFALACLDCSETVLIVDSNHVADWMNNKGAASAPTRGLSELNHLQLLERIAEIAHEGGLIGFEEQGKALTEIRKLTKLFWGDNRQQQVVAHIDPVGKSADSKLREVFYQACGRGLEVDPDMLARGIRGVRAFRFTSRTSNLTSAEVQQIIEALDFCIGDSDYRANSGRHHVLRKRLKLMIGTL